MEIRDVTPADLGDLLPLLRGYCDFYAVDPSDDALRALCVALLEDPREGVQILARDAGGAALGFATVYWGWQTLEASRIGVLNDLFTVPAARGAGVGRGLIEAARARCRARGATTLVWQTATTNLTAQRLYDGIGAERDDRWLDYSLAAG